MKNSAFIIIGVSGSGKTTIGKHLSSALNIPFFDADDYHPIENIHKMRSGRSLDDQDRLPWLRSLNHFLTNRLIQGDLVLACSALKESYRTLLKKGIEQNVTWISLNGDYSTIFERMKARNHFMPTGLLKSQFETWEPSQDGIQVDINDGIQNITSNILTSIKKQRKMIKSDIGLIGLGVMGKSLSRNIANNNFNISVYNRHVKGLEEKVAKRFIDAYPEMNSAKAYDSIVPFIQSLSIPRSIFLMVSAGEAVDHVINDLLPHLEPSDIIIDGGNSHYKDTQRRYDLLQEKGIEYIGTGVSGGEEGALKGPSIMPGGSLKGYKHVNTILEAIAAKDPKEKTCCSFIGNGGSGHFVKMVHNGIEYGEMQLIAETYYILKRNNGLSELEIASIFDKWGEGSQSSYLLEISADILRKEYKETPLIHQILDKAGNKGTGSWTTIAACELGVPINTITAALFARYHSSFKERRRVASKLIPLKPSIRPVDKDILLKAYTASRIINHHQGFNLIEAASKHYQWDINFKELARIWTNGCIIRSKLMETLASEFQSNPNILLNTNLKQQAINNHQSLQHLCAILAESNHAYPCFFSCIQYINAYVELQSGANMIQAQRDYFGAHTYERVDDPTGKKYHTTWTQ